MSQAINQSNQDVVQDMMVAVGHVPSLANDAVRTNSVITAAVIHEVLLSSAAIASKQDADLNSTQMASTGASSEDAADNNAFQASQSPNTGPSNTSINSLFQDQTDPMQADFNQYREISESLMEKEDLLQKLIALSYSMKNSFLICELMYNALGDVKGEDAAQYGAINNLDTALGNTNANAQNELNDAVKYLEGLVAPGSNAPAANYLLYDLNQITEDMNSFSWSKLTGDFNQFVADAKKYLPSSLLTPIQSDMNTMQANLASIASNQDGSPPGQGDTTDFFNAMFDIYNKLYPQAGSGLTDKLMTDLQNVVNDIKNGTDPTNDYATLVADAQATGNNSLYQIAQQVTISSGYLQQEYLGDMYEVLVNPSGKQPPVPPPPPVLDPTKAGPYLQAMCTSLDDLEQFIKSHSRLFGDGGAETIIQQIETIKGTFGASWGNGVSMSQQIYTWLENVNQKGIAPQQLQTLSGAIQSIDRATDAQSTSSRMTADFDLNQVKQILGGQESFVQAPLQAENGFVRNQKAQ